MDDRADMTTRTDRMAQWSCALQPNRGGQGLCLALLPILAVLSFLVPMVLPMVLPVVLPVVLIEGSLRADGSDGGGLSSGGSGRTMKAPRNSGGFVINLPNSSSSNVRHIYSTGFMGESLQKTHTRHLSGALQFQAMSFGTQVSNPLVDGSGRLATFAADGKTTVGLLLPTKEFEFGGLVGVEVPQKSGSGNKRNSQVPTIIYFTITSNNLLLDVPSVIATAKAGNIRNFTLRFYNLRAEQKVRLDLFVDVDQDQVHLNF